MDPNSQNEFNYQHLDNGYIRLLRLLPSSSPNLCCDMEQAQLASPDCPSFTALSYTWDGQALYRPLLINGQLLFVTPNVESFLRQVQWSRSPRNTVNAARDQNERHMFLRTMDLFWIDAICINQADVRERERQVPLMKQIYEKAHYIAIWLGEPKGNTRDAFEYIKQWHSDPEHREQIEQHPGRKALQELLQRPYWTRSWVLQEATTPKPQERKMVLCGNLQAPLEYFFELIPSTEEQLGQDADALPDRRASQDNLPRLMPWRRAVLRELGRLVHLDLESPSLEALLENRLGPPKDSPTVRRQIYDMHLRRGLNPMAREYFQRFYRKTDFDITAILQDIFEINLHEESSSLSPHQNLVVGSRVLEELYDDTLSPLQKISTERSRSGHVNLFNLFRHIQTQQASDLRDKIFAPLQLAKEAKFYRPTYEKPAWVVYCEFAATLIKTTQSLSILAYAYQTEKSAHMLPSWVPDWTRKEINGAAPLPTEGAREWDEGGRNEAEFIEALEGRISHITHALTPEEFQRLSPVDRPRLIVSAVELGTLTTSGIGGNLPFDDLAPYLRGRTCFSMDLKIHSSGEIILPYFRNSSPRILAPAVAEEGDKIFYVLGAQYPLILKKVPHRIVQRLANSAVVHPDGLKEYSFRGEAVFRYEPDSPASSNIENISKIIDLALTSLPWGLKKGTYKRILKTALNRRDFYEAELVRGPLCEIAIV